jgi:hypothetical protein
MSVSRKDWKANDAAHHRNHFIFRPVHRLIPAAALGDFVIMLILTYLLCVILACWYLREPREYVLPRVVEPNVNPAVDEWNARELVEESESFYE